MMKQEPFFSVVVPTYNRAALLPDVIHSIQNQTMGDFELILVDDGSTDNTGAVVQGMAATDPRIVYQYQRNAERGAARNTGIKAAKGTFVVFFDSDDEMRPAYLELLHAGIHRYPGYQFYAARYHFLINGREAASGITPVPAGEHGLPLLLKGNPFSCNFCIRRDNPGLVLFQQDRNLATVEDWMFLVENLQQEKILLLNESGVLMHQHEGRSMQQNKLLIDRRLAATGILLEKYRFSNAERKTLQAYSYYFCSIHAYLDEDRGGALRYLRMAAGQVGWNPAFLKAGFKYLAGRKFILLLKGRG